jgi:transcriptional regulator with XRE-family HTH domain
VAGKRRDRLSTLRKRRGWTQESLGNELGVTSVAVARWERGQAEPHAGKRRALARALDVSVEQLDRILANEDPDGDNDALEAPEQVGLFGTLEQSARTILTWEPVLVPGLLQTPRYAQVLLSTQDQVDARVRRQKVLTREKAPVHLRAVLDESVLHRPIGSVDTLRDQLNYLARLGEQYDNIDLRIMPLASERPPPGFGGIMIFQASWGGTVYSEHEAGGVYLAEPTQVANHEASFERLWQLAQPPRDSIETVRKRAMEL